MTKQKWEMHKIKKVTPNQNYELTCTFDNDVVKHYDLKPLFKKTGPMLEPLRNMIYFRRVFLEMGVPTWPNGFDICADVIYKEGKTAKNHKRPAA